MNRELTKGDPLYWACDDCKAAPNELCKAYDDPDRSWMRHWESSPYTFHRPRLVLANFARKYPAAIDIPCGQCGAPKNEVCRPFQPNKFGNVSTYACAYPHQMRRLGVETTASCRVRGCQAAGSRTCATINGLQIDTVLCPTHSKSASR